MNTPEQFIQACLPAAQAVKAKYGVPVAATIAQAALESGWGNHVKDNAYFGVKGVADAAGTTVFQTTEVIDGKVIHEQQTFRAYTDFADAAMGYGAFLRSNERYAGCFQFTNDPENFIRVLAEAGYATAPSYALQVVSIIRQHNLAQYDKETNGQ